MFALLDQLKIPASTMRPGPSGTNRQAPNYQNTDEAKANPWPHLPELMATKSRKPVTTPETWVPTAMFCVLGSIMPEPAT